MIQNPPCPVCSGTDWLTIRQHPYEDTRTKRNPGGLTQELRKEVLFQIWFPGEPRVCLTTQCCRNCGFVCYRPRPDSDDIRKKYEFLREHERMGVLHVHSERAARNDRARSERVFSLLSSRRNLTNARVLDVGGGDGRFLLPFLKHTAGCFLVDFNQHPVDGITRLGNELKDLGTTTFDVIICSHVLEHVADPCGMLLHLKALLEPKSLLYVEVPDELWLDAPIRRDPVTHINFFTKDSLMRALDAAGLGVARIERGIVPYGVKYKRVLWALAESQSNGNRRLPNASEALESIRPGLAKRVKWKLESLWIHAHS